MLKTKVREETALLNAKLKTDLKFKDKYSLEIVKQKIMEKISDPDIALKYITIFGVAIIIKNGIDWTEKVAAAIPSWAWMAAPLLGLFRSFIPQPEEGLTPSEISEWLVSIALAYLIVINFGEIIRGVGASVGGILDIAKMLLLVGV
jgi:hypothetical protein